VEGMGVWETIGEREGKEKGMKRERTGNERQEGEINMNNKRKC